jgi:hypothetical protein
MAIRKAMLKLERNIGGWVGVGVESGYRGSEW